MWPLVALLRLRLGAQWRQMAVLLLRLLRCRWRVHRRMRRLRRARRLLLLLLLRLARAAANHACPVRHAGPRGLAAVADHHLPAAAAVLTALRATGKGRRPRAERLC